MNAELKTYIFATLIDPIVRAKSYGIAEGKKEACVPMDENEDVKNDASDAEGIRKIRPRFCFLKKFNHTIKT